MVTQYPGKIDNNTTLPDAVDNITPVKAEVVNRLKQAIIAIENELGTKPSGVYSTLKARLASTESLISNLQIIKIDQDLGGTVDLPLVIGLNGIPISNTLPAAAQALVFNGLTWAPTTLAAGSFGFTAAGDLSGSELMQTVVGLQGRALASTAPSDGEAVVWDAGGSTWKPGTIISFTAGGDLTGTNISQTVAKINGTTITTAGGALSPGSVLRVTAVGTADWGQLNLADADAVTGSLPITNFAAGTNGYVLSTVSLAPTWVPQLPARYELNFASGLFSTTSTSFTRAGGRQIDMSVFPATIGALTRTVAFSADIDMTGGATSVEVQLYDITHSVAVTSTDLTSSSTTNTRVTSGSLTVGSSAGNVRSDVATQYELQFKMNGGGGSDAVFLTNSRLVITYA